MVQKSSEMLILSYSIRAKTSMSSSRRFWTILNAFTRVKRQNTDWPRKPNAARKCFEQTICLQTSYTVLLVLISPTIVTVLYSW